MYWHSQATARAVEDAGVRAVAAAPLIDDGDPAKSGRACADAERSLEQIMEAGGELAKPGFAPHAIYTVSPESLRWVAARAAELDIPVQIHLSETEGEVTQCLELYGKRPAFHLDDVGLLGPGTILAHGVWLDDSELELIAARGATVVTNPVANMKLAVGGVFPYPAARERGVAMGLGTDGAGSNNSLDLLADAKAFALIQKHRAADPAITTASETLRLATGALSPLLDRGGLVEGAPADFLLVSLDAPELSVGGLEAGLVYAASGTVVDTTVVNGRVLMRNGIVEGAAEVVERTRERARGLGLTAPASAGG